MGIVILAFECAFEKLFNKNKDETKSTDELERPTISCD